MFSFSRLKGVDPMLGVEMASTGEVGCLGSDIHEALLKGLIATGFRFPTRGVLLSLGPVADKYDFSEEALAISEEMGLPIFATEGTAEMLSDIGIACSVVAKLPGDGHSAMELLDNGTVDLIINVPREYDRLGRPDGYLIRRRAVETGIPLITDLHLARALISALRQQANRMLEVKSLQEYFSS